MLGQFSDAGGAVLDFAKRRYVRVELLPAALQGGQFRPRRVAALAPGGRAAVLGVVFKSAQLRRGHIPRSDRDHFAARCGTTAAFLRNVIYGQRKAGEKLCVATERESGGVVTRRDLRPGDWHLIGLSWLNR
ncbi:helix-turn-helix domain-containing protein [Burkholderia multivorans]|uniref:helix-turn-helix domain-containing protein n=1 Tax=Burkholderia multivorans TaxID=87883 RepID=UPI002158C0DE|nr:helix-turn-helix domain-containing protein [Burkholderia multivorans]